MWNFSAVSRTLQTTTIIFFFVEDIHILLSNKSRIQNVKRNQKETIYLCKYWIAYIKMLHNFQIKILTREEVSDFHTNTNQV